MVFDASNLDRLETVIARNSRHVSPDTRLHFLGDAPATFFRAENDVDTIAGVGMRHRVVPPGLGGVVHVYPALKRWAKIDRASGTYAGLCLVIDAPTRNTPGREEHFVIAVTPGKVESRTSVPAWFSGVEHPVARKWNPTAHETIYSPRDCIVPFLWNLSSVRIRANR